MFRLTLRFAVLAVVVSWSVAVAFAQTPTAVPDLPAAGASATLDQGSEPISLGDIAVSGFSGSLDAPETATPGGAAPEPQIDSQGPVLRVFDMSGIGAVPAGQVATPHAKIEINAGLIGQVFALAFDDGTNGGPPNLYAGATSAFGIRIVAAQLSPDGKPIRLAAGAPDARFMDGQFGGIAGSGPGTIYRIDGTTGIASVFANTDANGIANSGPGLGALAFDPLSHSLYASDLDTGLIHRFQIGDGSGTAMGPSELFDHGTMARPAVGRSQIADDGQRMEISRPDFLVTDLRTWGLTPLPRRITGLAVHDGRLYYATAEGPEIWSISLTTDGRFGTNARIETALRPPVPAVVSTIIFDNEGRMTVALRGVGQNGIETAQFVAADSGIVLRFLPNAAAGDDASAERWLPGPQEYAVGAAGGNRNAAGGASFIHGFDPEGVFDANQCEANLVLTGDGLTDPLSTDTVSHGLQLNATGLVRPDNAPPTKSVFIDFDGRRGDTDARGQVGTVLAVRRCVDAASIVANGAGPAPDPIDGAAAGGGADPSGPRTAASDGSAPAGQTGVRTGRLNESEPRTGQSRTALSDLSVPADQVDTALMQQNQKQDCTSKTVGSENCLTTDAGQTTAGTGLVITKSARAPSCDKDLALGLWRCAFTITLTNMGSATFEGPIELADQSSFPTRVSFAEPIGSCTDGPQDHRCTIDRLALAPKQRVQFDLNTTVAFASVPISTPPGGCKVDNTIAIIRPSGVGPGQQASATAQLASGPNLGRAIACDPPNLHLAKTAKGCVPAGKSYECRYSISVQSMGPDPFQEGIVEVDELLPPGGVVKAVSTGWICWGTGPKTHCRHGKPVTLAVEEKLTLDLVVRVPRRTVPDGQCEVENVAQIATRAGEVVDPTSARRSAAVAKINSPTCTPPAPVCPVGYVGNYPECAPQTIACSGGMVPISTDSCACPDGTQFSEKRNACVSLPCPAGYSGTYPECSPPAPVEQRLPERQNKKTKVCSGERPVGTYPNCCPRGTYADRGACIRMPKKGPPTTTAKKTPKSKYQAPPENNVNVQINLTKKCPYGQVVLVWQGCPGY